MEATFTTTARSSPPRPYEVLDVGGEGGDQPLGAAGVAGGRPARPYLRVRGGEFGRHGRGEAVRQDTARGQFLRPFGQRAVHRVVAAEDQRREGRQAAVGERGRLGDHAGGRVQARRYGGAAGHGGGGDGAAGTDQPHSHAGAGKGRGHGQPP
ncbi:hypothetical protein GCM10017687_87900 [Streptomyces echinatus]